jgi:uncharacterized protein YacL
MTLWVLRILTIIIGPIIGWFEISSDWKGIAIGVTAALLIIAVEIIIERVPLNHLIYGMVGAVIGFAIAFLVTQAIFLMDEPHISRVMHKYAPLLYVVLTYLGMVISVRRQEEIDRMDRGEPLGKGYRRKNNDIKVVDTSAIIDGRIADVYETKFLSGTLIVGRFILKELQDIADSADSGKRARGRRGLDILQHLQEHPDIQVKVVDKDYPEVRDVDGKLVMLAREFDAQVLTTDFNLNKVASLQGVTVLNVNDLANALKPAVLPGDGMTIFIAKDGKEKEQGVGYLDDGTMVVVEEGRRLVGKKVEAVVTSVLQTSAGRMIFTKLRDGQQRTNGEASAR